VVAAAEKSEVASVVTSRRILPGRIDRIPTRAATSIVTGRRTNDDRNHPNSNNHNRGKNIEQAAKETMLRLAPRLQVAQIVQRREEEEEEGVVVVHVDMDIITRLAVERTTTTRVMCTAVATVVEHFHLEDAIAIVKSSSASLGTPTTPTLASVTATATTTPRMTSLLVVIIVIQSVRLAWLLPLLARRRHHIVIVITRETVTTNVAALLDLDLDRLAHTVDRLARALVLVLARVTTRSYKPEVVETVARRTSRPLSSCWSPPSKEATMQRMQPL